jgi:hypothetical protein
MRKFVAAALLLFLLGVTNTADIQYQPLQDIKVATYQQKTVPILYKGSEYSVNLELFSQDNGYRFSYIESTFVDASQSVFKFAEQEGVYRSTECSPIHNLEIYDVDWSVLNDSSRFGVVQNPSAYGMQGLYDPRLSEPGVSSVMITDHSKSGTSRTTLARDILIAHEISHYWYDRFCFNNGWHGDAESFAIKFESYYLKDRRR